MVTFEMKLITPRAPNYIILDDGHVGSRGDGMKERPTIAVSQLSKEQKDALAKAWRDDLDAVAERQKTTE